MTLLVDVGNTALKWALLEDEALVLRGRLNVTELSSDAALEQQWAVLAPPRRVLIASVAATPVTEQISTWCRERWQSEILTVQAQADSFGVRNAYRDPGRLGVDRWLAMVAARARGSAAACVVDCGSAVTVDVLDKEGGHLGGLIVPGLEMMKVSLGSCAQISLDSDADQAISLLARDTHNAVRGGTLYAIVAFIDRVVADVGGELRSPMRYLITGGDASSMLSLLRHPFEYAPDLVLEGLAVVSRGVVCAS